MDITFGDDTKSPFSDMQEGQQTYFTHYILNKGTPEQSQFLKSCMGKKLTEQEIEELQQIFEKSGAIAAGKELISEHAKQAKQALENIRFVNPIAAQGITALIDKIVKI